MAQIKPDQIESSSDGQILRVAGGQTGFGSNYGFNSSDKKLMPTSASKDGVDTSLNISQKPLDFLIVFLNGKLRSVGNGETSKDCYFVDARTPGHHVFASVFGNDHILARKADGTIWSWGAGGGGRLGNNTIITRSSAVSVVGDHSFSMINGAGDDFSSALKADGSAWMWGSGTAGVLGNNSIVNRSSPVSVVGNHSFTKVVVGGSTNLGLKSDGTVWAWGDGAAGKLGQATSTGVDRSSPVSVAGEHSFIDAICGANHLAALKADGSIWTWGENTDGQLGNNTVTNRSSPTSIIGDHSFVSLSISNSESNNTLALKSDGSAWIWGLNTSGRLGDNTATHRSSPVSVIGDHSFILLFAGFAHVLALKSDGSAWAWGEGSSGRLGHNAITDRSSPISVLGGHSFITLSAAVSNSVAIRGDGITFAWGNNTLGQLADNTINSASTPILIIGPVGGPPKQFNNILPGDRMVWNSYVSGINLSTNDRFDFIYIV